MGRLILVEGLDLAGKSTLIRGLVRRFYALGWAVRVSHGDLCPDNPVARVTRSMMRRDPDFTPAEGAPLFLASHLWDQRNFQAPSGPYEVHIQDSCALRSLAFERVVGEEFYCRKLEQVVDALPSFDAAYLLTASIKNRRERYLGREKNDLHDAFMLRDPVRFSRIDSELLRLGASRYKANLISTDEFTPQALLDLVWSDLKRKFGLQTQQKKGRPPERIFPSLKGWSLIRQPVLQPSWPDHRQRSDGNRLRARLSS